MKTLKKILIIAVVFAMILILPKLVKADTPFSITGRTIKLNQSAFIMREGGSGPITWTSSDPSTVSVDENGTVTGLKIGKATITAKRGEGGAQETATCEITVEYSYLNIGANSGESVAEISLVLGLHPTENLKIKVTDYANEIVSNPVVTYASSDTSVATVDTNGKVTGVKAGEATITASAAGVTDTVRILVSDKNPETDFSKANIKVTYEGTGDTQALKIEGVKPKDTSGYEYCYKITSDNKKPELTIKQSGMFDREASGFDLLSVNAEENYLYRYNFEQYSELNQDLYLWVVEEVKQPTYYDEDGNWLMYETRFEVEGKKIERLALPPLNIIIKSSHIGEWKSSDNAAEEAYTYINFNFPTATEQRKFTLKIGKVTDNSILNKIKNEDYSGIQDLLQYAKTHEAIYTENLTTTSEGYYRSDDALFDGKKLLTDDAYYYMYVQFDDENGKYFPVEGVTLGQAYISPISEHWFLTAYTEDNFEWSGLTSTYTPSDNKPTSAQTKPDPTVAPTSIPQTGQSIIVAIAIVSVVGFGVYTYRRLKNYRDVI